MPRVSLAERKRQLVRDELTEAALKLLAFQGFEATTIDQMAAAAGLSRRTFFRYFQSKEDVIIELPRRPRHRCAPRWPAACMSCSAPRSGRRCQCSWTPSWSTGRKAMVLAKLDLDTLRLRAWFLDGWTPAACVTH